jgi:hypothetical protein
VPRAPLSSKVTRAPENRFHVSLIYFGIFSGVRVDANEKIKGSMKDEGRCPFVMLSLLWRASTSRF